MKRSCKYVARGFNFNRLPNEIKNCVDSAVFRTRLYKYRNI